MVSAIIPAAGLSERMGNKNKLLLPYKNETVISATIKNILAADIFQVIVVTGHESSFITDAIKELPVTIVFNRDYTEGLTRSIQTGVRRATGNGYMICLADMLLLTAGEYKQLTGHFETAHKSDPDTILIPRYKNQKGNPVIFSENYRERILYHQEMDGCRKLLESFKKNIQWVDMESDNILIDMDYPEEYYKIAGLL